MTSSGQKETGSFKIFVGGLDPNTTEDDLTEYFSKFGKVVERLIKVDIKTKRSRGFAFIGFKLPESVDRVLEIEDHILHGKKIDCKRAMTKEDAYSLNKNLKESCRKVYISNIPKELTKKDLYDSFSDYGRIKDFNLIFKKKETGFLYIIFETEEEAVNLIERKYIDINGYRLEIQKAIPKESKETIEEDSKGKHNYSYQGHQVPRYRNSFESPSPYGYESYYPVPSNVPILGSHHQKHSPYNYFDGGQSGHRMGESHFPYDRQIMSQHPMPMQDNRYQPSRAYPQMAYGSPGELLSVDTVPQRSRVRSEQTINTVGQPFGTGGIYNGELRPVARSRMGGHSFSHVDSRPFAFQGAPDTEQIFQIESRPGTHEFIENKMDFSAFKNKEISPKLEKKKDSPVSKTESRSAKQAKIKALEEEIKLTKEKLKGLEERLRLEYATVDEKLSNHEALSHSSNNE